MSVKKSRGDDGRGMAQGSLVVVVGPSGAGKDTVMAAAQVRLAETGRGESVVFVRRVTTRPSAHAAEDSDLMSPAAFSAARQAGAFALAWEAHGLGYGVPRSIVDDLAAGRTVVVNVSRRVIPEAEQLWPRLTVVHIFASPDVLAARIAARGRETRDDARTRLGREVRIPECRAPVVEICNEGTVAKAAEQLADLLRRLMDKGA